MARTLVILIVALPSLAVALRPLLRRLRTPPPRDVTVVKLGGSAITDKARFETLDEAGLRAAAEAVRRCVADGARPGAPAVAVAAPRVATRRRELRATRATAAFVADALRLADAGFTPVLHGDAVLDDAQRHRAGDALLRRCAADLAARGRLAAVCFLTDVDGVFTRPPAEPGAAPSPVVDGAAPRASTSARPPRPTTSRAASARRSTPRRPSPRRRAPWTSSRARRDADAALRGARPPRGTRIRPAT
ncbi:hypothetical protein JL720_11606 [Aureococcus anophagefferens]|nr:hypothetical protein JL720_11606 [Aureococcus anophagefferens]